MVNTAPMTITFNQALDILARLQAAAPSQTAGKLEQIAMLMKSLAEENTYLSTLVVEELPKTGLLSQTGSLAAPEPEPKAAPPPGENSPNWFAGFSDALRPPLIAIRGRADLVQAGLLGQITPEQDDWLRAIQENADRAFSVLDSVQAWIALQKGQTHIERVNFISTDLLKDAWESIRDRAKTFGHEITIQAPDVVPLVRGDFYQSLIILIDLLDNAMYYTPPGGQIRMSVDDLGTHVLFSVADNGVGLLPDDLDSIGQPFWRGSHRLIRQHNGVGLRLFLAKQVLELLDGELIFSGEPGLGSTFSFMLPVPD